MKYLGRDLVTSWVQGLRLRERLVDILVEMFGERLGEIFQMIVWGRG